MKTLTINQRVFKHQDTQTKLKIALFENDSRVSLDSNSEYQFKIKNSSGYLKSEKLTIEDDRLVLTTDKFKDLTPDTYNFEVWENEDSIYPSENYGYFKITKNVSEIDGETIPVITIEDFEKRFAEAVKNAKGEKGDTGPQGLPGPVGPQGPKGERGEVGPKGEKGDTGPQGEKGDKGDKGDTGERGADGKDGRDGINGKDGINGTNGRDGVDGKNGQDGKSAYQIWLDLGNSGSEQDFINSLKPKVERHAPTGCTLDTSTKPWTVWFSNGCGFQIEEYWNNKWVYRCTETWFSNDFNEGIFPSIPSTIMRASLGGLEFVEKIKSNPNKISAAYWSDSAVVLNPIRDKNDYDWSKAYLNEASVQAAQVNEDYRLHRHHTVVRLMYELGIWDGATVESFGAVRKAGN